MIRTLAAILFLMSFSAFAVNCEQLKAKISKVESKGVRLGKAQRLKDKYQALCVEGKSKEEWKQVRSANKGQYQSMNKCSRLSKKLERAKSKGKEKRIAKIQEKLAANGCGAGSSEGAVE